MSNFFERIRLFYRAAFFLIDRFREFIIDIPLLERLVLLAEIAVATGLILCSYDRTTSASSIFPKPG